MAEGKKVCDVQSSDCNEAAVKGAAQRTSKADSVSKDVSEAKSRKVR